MRPVTTAPRPPRDPGTLHVERLKAGQELLFHIVSEKVLGIYTHWDARNNCSWPCFADSCDKCGKMPKRWKGFLQICRCNDRRHLMLELTSTATVLLHDQVQHEDNLRAIRCRAWRGKGGDNSRLRVEVYGEQNPHTVLPAEIDPFPTLRKIWASLPGVDFGS